MKKLTLLLSLLAGVLNSNAEVFVYKHTITGTDMGKGFTQKIAYSGFTVSDDFGDFIQLLVDVKTKKFWVWYLPDIALQYVNGANASESVFVINESLFTDVNGYEFRDYACINGVIADVPVNGTIWSVPKSATWVGFSQWFDADGDAYSEKTSGKLTLDLKATGTSNSFGDEIDAAINRLKQGLLLKGYSEL
jgi:hypothetical protein